MKQGFIGGLMTLAWFSMVVATPFYILWRFGLHVLAEAAGFGMLLIWIFTRGGVDPGAPTAVFLANLPSLAIAIGCLFFALVIRIAIALGVVPKWAAGHKHDSVPPSAREN